MASFMAADAQAAAAAPSTAETVRQAGPMPSLAPIVRQLRPVVVNINSRFKPKRRVAQRVPPGRPRINPGPPNNDEQPPAQRTIQAAPGDVTSSRPVSEPTDTTKR